MGSDFDTKLTVFTGSTRALKQVACDDDRLAPAAAVELKFSAEKTYFLVVSTCCDPSVSAGGSAVLHLYRPVKLTVNTALTSADAGDISGATHLSGRTRCSNPGIVTVTVTVRQRIGARVARGSGEVSAKCEAKIGRWSIMVDSETGVAFRPRRAHITLVSAATDGFVSTSSPTFTEVRRLGLSQTR